MFTRMFVELFERFVYLNRTF